MWAVLAVPVISGGRSAYQGAAPSVADPFPRYGEFSKSDAERLCEVAIALHNPPPNLLYTVGLSHSWKYAEHVSELKGPDGKGCKVAVGNRNCLPAGTVRLTHTTPSAARLEDIPPKTREMDIAELPCRNVLAEKEKKCKKAEAKAAVEADASGNMEKTVGKKRPLEALAKEAYVYKNASAARLDTLRNHIDEQGTPRHNDNVNEPLVNEGVNLEHGDENIIDEGHGDNVGGLFGLHI
uniref:Uncharacterized protein n=1 Tax=Tanacetum cinerariifolium TaxID=118510 RepID=A0A699JYC5_TANCI|nr:hypothetical protein [Tanacetum cinerariifolium]